MAYHRAILKGEDVSDWHFNDEITEPHDGFKKWIGENQERIENAKSLPYWIKDNHEYSGISVDSRNDTASGHKGFGTHKPTKHGEQFEPIPMKPVVLDKDQINNRDEIARLAGFTEKEIERMKPMNFDEADSGFVNSLTGKNINTAENCQLCVLVFELRCRGLNVTAKGYETGGFIEELSNNQALAYLKKNKELPQITKYNSKEEVLGFLNGSEIAKNGRYQIGINKWINKKDGHILNLITVKGKVYLYDGQENIRLNIQDIIDSIDFSKGVEFLRTDNLLLNPKTIQIFERI